MKGKRKVMVWRELFHRKPKEAEQGPEPVQGSLTGAIAAGIAMLPPGVETIIIKASVNMPQEEIAAAERELTQKTGKRVVILGSWAAAVVVTTEARKDFRETVGISAKRAAAKLKKWLGVRSPSKELMEAANKALEDAANELKKETWEARATEDQRATYYFCLQEFVARMRSYLDRKGIDYETRSPFPREYIDGSLYCIETVGVYDDATEFYLYLRHEQKMELARLEAERRD